MNRIMRSTVFLLCLLSLGLGIGCGNQESPKAEKDAVPKEGPKSLERPWGAPPPPPSNGN